MGQETINFLAEKISKILFFHEFFEEKLFTGGGDYKVSKRCAYKVLIRCAYKVLRSSIRRWKWCAYKVLFSISAK